MAPEKPRVFLDTHVLIAGIASATGASSAILTLSEVDMLHIVLSRQVLIEADRNIESKLPAALDSYRMFIKNLRPLLVSDPTPHEVRLAERWIHAKDAPILAAAIKSRVDYLVSMDIRDFHTPQVRKNVPFPILIPSEFLTIFRREHLKL